LQELADKNAELIKGKVWNLLIHSLALVFECGSCALIHYNFIILIETAYLYWYRRTLIRGDDYYRLHIVEFDNEVDVHLDARLAHDDGLVMLDHLQLLAYSIHCDAGTAGQLLQAGDHDPLDPGIGLVFGLTHKVIDQLVVSELVVHVDALALTVVVGLLIVQIEGT